MKTKKVKKKLNVKKLFIFILFIYLFSCIGYYLFNEPIRNIVITGTTYVEDYEIIEAAGIKEYPAILGLNTKKMEKEIKKIPLVENVKIKRNLFFRLTIDIEELKIILINNNKELLLSNGSLIKNNFEYLGIPLLINYTPESILKDLALNLGKVDLGIISLINQIEYSPSITEEGVSIDKERFILYMNDGNTIYTNVEKCNILNHYREIYASLNDQKGILNLDSGNKENFVFTKY